MKEKQRKKYSCLFECVNGEIIVLAYDEYEAKKIAKANPHKVRIPLEDISGTKEEDIRVWCKGVWEDKK